MLSFYQRKQQKADRAIRRRGMRALLRRGTSPSAVDRDCWILETNFITRSRAGELTNPANRQFIMSAVGLSSPPDREKDRLVLRDPVSGTERETLKINATP